MSCQVITADVLDGLKSLSDRSVQCVITSPPYWGLRDYGEEGQIGLEPTPEQHIEQMCRVGRELWRVLRDDGTFWLNYGDCFWSQTYSNRNNATDGPGGNGVRGGGERTMQRQTSLPLKQKDLVGMPWRIAFALQADGWYLRSDIIWSKPNPMPESVTDRPTKAHEYVFLLTKSPRYFYDADAVREAHQDAGGYRVRGQVADSYEHPNAKGRKTAAEYRDRCRAMGIPEGHSNGRNLRSVWHIPTQPFPEAHFATFPEKLVEPCVKAGTSEKGCCPECGKAWERVVERGEVISTGGSKTGARASNMRSVSPLGQDPHKSAYNTGEFRAHAYTTLGFRPACECCGIPIPCTVLDPFCGSGTTGVVACQLGRDFIGIELNPEYAKMAERRIGRALRPNTYRDDTEDHDAPLFRQEAF